MERWRHGGNVYEAAAQMGCTPEDILDVSASINPLGPPAGLKELLFERFSRVVHYPEVENRDLSRAIAAHHELDDGYVAVGNGSTELLFWLPHAFGWNRVAVVVPTFSEYIRAAEKRGATVRRLTTSWEHGFQPTVYQLEALIASSHPDALFLTTPGSPSGVPLDAEVRAFIEASVADSPFFWVIDEVFADFCDEVSLARLVKRSPRVIVIRSLTKFYALPGLRLGYLLAHPSVVQRLKGFLPPWSVNTFAQTAGVYCLGEERFRNETLAFFARERRRVFQALDEISSIAYLKSAANYVLLRLAPSCGVTASEVCQRLLFEHRILLRDCSNFEGLSQRFLRAAIASEAVNDRWIGALKEIL